MCDKYKPSPWILTMPNLHQLDVCAYNVPWVIFDVQSDRGALIPPREFISASALLLSLSLPRTLELRAPYIYNSWALSYNTENFPLNFLVSFRLLNKSRNNNNNSLFLRQLECHYTQSTSLLTNFASRFNCDRVYTWLKLCCREFETDQPCSNCSFFVYFNTRDCGLSSNQKFD